MEKHLDSMVMVAHGASRNVRIVRMYSLTVLFTFTMVIIINSILGLTSINVESHVLLLLLRNLVVASEPITSQPMSHKV